MDDVERAMERWEPVVAPSGAPGRAHAIAADDTTVELGTIEGFQVNVPITGIDAAALERLKALPDTEITLEGTFTEYGMEKMVLGPAIKAAWEEAQTAEDAESLMLILQRLAAVAGVKD